ncbi:MAG: hypothetical protein GX299_03025 [Epulopiscium sp.]|nr:hypothetical protein [Candidatus Epulonipiscium sp.]
MYATKEYYDPERCRACRGKCCAIYLPIEKGGSYPSGWTWVDEWFENWFEAFEDSGAASCGIEPLFDPYDLLFDEDRSAHTEVYILGGDPGYCQYWRYDVGCLLPRKYRPPGCREYRCADWLRDLQQANAI